MSISDELMWRYYELLSFKSSNEISAIKKAVDDGSNPRDAKFGLAEEIIARFHSELAAKDARESFVGQFARGGVPEDIAQINLAVDLSGIRIANLLKEASLVSSTSEGMRMINQGAVKIDGQKVADTALTIPPDTEMVVQVGKRKWAKVST